MQKYWTFQNQSDKKIHSQITLYLALTILNLIINTFLVFIFVDHYGVNYLAAQIIAGLLIASESYFLYRYIFIV